MWQILPRTSHWIYCLSDLVSYQVLRYISHLCISLESRSTLAFRKKKYSRHLVWYLLMVFMGWRWLTQAGQHTLVLFTAFLAKLHKCMIYIFCYKNWPRLSLDHASSEIGQIDAFGSVTFMKSSLKHKENEEKFKMDSILFNNYIEKRPSRVRWKWLELKRIIKSWIWDSLVITNVRISMDIDGYQSVGTKM